MKRLKNAFVRFIDSDLGTLTLIVFIVIVAWKFVTGFLDSF